MKRRDILKAAGLGIAGSATLAMPAIAQSQPKLTWRCTSSFPKALDTIYGGAETFAKYVSEATEGNWTIQNFAAGEIVPGLQAADAAAAGTVELCHTASYYYWGKDPTYALGTAVPFGLNNRQMNAWLYSGGGNELLNEFYATQSLYGLPAGNTGVQMGGWFRKEINTVADMQGLKMRIGGMGGKIIEKIGVVPQQIAGGDIYPALEKGTIDASEWVGPYDDEKLGFYKVAQYYYYPGWWEGGPDAAPALQPGEVERASAGLQIHRRGRRGDGQRQDDGRLRLEESGSAEEARGAGRAASPLQPGDHGGLLRRGARRPTPRSRRRTPTFTKTFDAMAAFRKDSYLWMQLSEYNFDTFMMILQRNNKI